MSPPPAPTFVGALVCGECHENQLKQWTGSHHQLATQPAGGATVQGDFSNVKFTSGGVTSNFFRRDGKFIVRTDGPDGALHDYEIKFAFGVSPLQQYLVVMPGGRLQALGIAWDSRPRELGGQRWFPLYPAEKTSASDSLHWTGIDQTWNYMCADCHSTNVRKNYDLRTRGYETTYAEINVACEACHGPGSNHVMWAKRAAGKKLDGEQGLTIALDERKGVRWIIDFASGNSRRSMPRASEREIQMCARCHSRRGQIHEDYVHGQPVGDDYRVALLNQDLYFPDGQIKGEVYEYGSFIQSRMFHAGVTCSDCHDPHALTLRAAGNNVCLRCHLPRKYDSPQHHFHKIGAAGSRCVECHMPTRTYMIVHPRHDHSLRIPRPDLSVKLGTPNACNNCHPDKSPRWASDAVNKWYRHPPKGFQRFAEVLHDGVIGAPASELSLDELAAKHDQPAIARATALTLLAAHPDHRTDAAAGTVVVDPSPLVKRAAAAALSNSNLIAAASILAPNLTDRIRDVRIETAEVLAGAPLEALPTEVAAALGRAIDEYAASQRLNADRPEAHLNLSLLFAKRRNFDAAEAELKIALSLDPSFAPATVNLADLYRVQGHEAKAEAVLRRGLQQSPHDASLFHALGLLMVRQRQMTRALELLAAAARIDPGNARYVYVYAVALNDNGQARTAIDTLERSIKLHPYDLDTLNALATFLERTGDSAKARSYRERLDQLAPQNP